MGFYEAVLAKRRIYEGVLAKSIIKQKPESLLSSYKKRSFTDFFGEALLLFFLHFSSLGVGLRYIYRAERVSLWGVD